jgi:carboxylesterase type B
MLHSLVAGIASILIVSIRARIAAAEGPLVTLINGTYQGVHHEAYNQDFFLGVPYAQPPVGHLRLNRPARLNTSFESVRQATAYGMDCPGVSPFPGHTMSEDCLTINIIRPSGFEDTPLPVVLWIYGCV